MPPPAVREGGEKFLKLTPSQKKTVRHQFDSFCKKILREEARDYIRHISWRYEHEISMSELSEKQMKRFCILDEYPSEQFHFHVQGINIALRDEILANALVSLSDEKRDIVLLSYLLDMTDQEIANKLNIVRRTVQYKRTNSLKEMKRRMEVLEYGKKFD
jgi:RNA polymerase sigma factor (sigma-70 family)